MPIHICVYAPASFPAISRLSEEWRGGSIRWFFNRFSIIPAACLMIIGQEGETLIINAAAGLKPIYAHCSLGEKSLLALSLSLVL